MNNDVAFFSVQRHTQLCVFSAWYAYSMFHRQAKERVREREIEKKHNETLKSIEMHCNYFIFKRKLGKFDI